MSVYGIIKKFEVITLEKDLSDLSADEKSLESYIRQKHKTASDNGRFVVRFEVSDNRFEKAQIVSAFIPKGIIEHNLIEPNTYIECSSTSCNLKIVGVDDWYDRASNGQTQIYDARFKHTH